MSKITIDRSVVEQALEAMSLALSDVDWRKDSPTQPVIHKAYNATRAALEQPQVEQEPAIYPEEAFDMGLEAIPYYTHPQPPRQPLTDEQITELADAHMEAFAQFVGAGEVWFEGEKEFARAIERAHGIGGEK